MSNKIPPKHGRARQYAALPFRGAPGHTEVMLLTSRGTGRWVLPKGWAEKGKTGPAMAAKEAMEEGGILGEVGPWRVARYEYSKDGIDLRVDVFPLVVETLLDDWPERAERTRQWFTLAQAAMEVDEGGLVELFLRLSAEDIEVADAAVGPPMSSSRALNYGR